eukprot:1157836-Pelagomonas_calceolata.AAC.6
MNCIIRLRFTEMHMCSCGPGTWQHLSQKHWSHAAAAAAAFIDIPKMAVVLVLVTMMTVMITCTIHAYACYDQFLKLLLLPPCTFTALSTAQQHDSRTSLLQPDELQNKY